MKEQLEKIRQEALGALDGVKDAGELDALRVRFLGKKGELTGVLKSMGKLSARSWVRLQTTSARPSRKRSRRSARSSRRRRSRPGSRPRPSTLPSPARPCSWATGTR